MKALMMIPMRDPPTFTHSEKWSKEFRDFVNQCLLKEPEKRKSASEMLNVNIMIFVIIKKKKFFSILLF